MSETSVVDIFSHLKASCRRRQTTRLVHLRKMYVVRIDEFSAEKKNPQWKGTLREANRNGEEEEIDERTEGKNGAAEGHRRR